MEIKFSNPLQCHIANLMWEAQTNKEVSEIIQKYGKDAYVVRDMIVATALDGMNDVEIAQTLLEDIFNRG